MEFLGTHRGAELYKVLNEPEKESEKITLRKVKAEGVYSEQKNQKVEFFAEGETWKEAAKKLPPQIDQYLDERNWDEFEFDLL